MKPLDSISEFILVVYYRITLYVMLFFLAILFALYEIYMFVKKAAGLLKGKRKKKIEF